MNKADGKLAIEHSFPENVGQFKKIQALNKENIQYGIFESGKDLMILIDGHKPGRILGVQKYLQSEDIKQLGYSEKTQFPKLVFLPKSRFLGLVFENTNLQTESSENRKYSFDFEDLERYI